MGVRAATHPGVYALHPLWPRWDIEADQIRIREITGKVPFPGDGLVGGLVLLKLLQATFEEAGLGGGDGKHGRA